MAGILNKRFNFRGRSFAPTGKAERIGATRNLGRIDEYGPARTITLLVGQDKGTDPRNQGAACRRVTDKLTVAQVDSKFFELRSTQVDKEFVGATRQAGKGWYKGEPEASVAFEVAYIPPEGGGSPSEPTFATFSANMNRLAESMAKALCQDSILIIRDDGNKRSVAAAIWENGDG